MLNQKEEDRQWTNFPLFWLHTSFYHQLLGTVANMLAVETAGGKVSSDFCGNPPVWRQQDAGRSHMYLVFPV